MKSKLVIIIIGTLVIGFILGMLTSAQIRYQKLKPMRVYFSEERFRKGFYDVIQPDDKQKEEIEKILDKYARINHDLQNDFRKQLDANVKALRKEIDSKLTREQVARLKELDEKREEMIRQGRINRANDSIRRRYNRRDDDRHYRPDEFRPSEPDTNTDHTDSL